MHCNFNINRNMLHVSGDTLFYLGKFNNLPELIVGEGLCCMKLLW